MSCHRFDGLRSRGRFADFANGGGDHEARRRTRAHFHQRPGYIETTDADQIEQSELPPTRVPQRRACADIETADQHAEEHKPNNDSPRSEIAVELEYRPNADAGPDRKLFAGESGGEIAA